jgi:hypothetical protein
MRRREPRGPQRPAAAAPRPRSGSACQRVTPELGHTDPLPCHLERRGLQFVQRRDITEGRIRRTLRVRDRPRSDDMQHTVPPLGLFQPVADGGSGRLRPVVSDHHPTLEVEVRHRYRARAHHRAILLPRPQEGQGLASSLRPRPRFPACCSRSARCATYLARRRRAYARVAAWPWRSGSGKGHRMLERYSLNSNLIESSSSRISARSALRATVWSAHTTSCSPCTSTTQTSKTWSAVPSQMSSSPRGA